MAFHRLLSVLAAATLPMSLVACGGDSGQPTPEGPHYHYVASAVMLPSTNDEATTYGLDLNDDGTVDNQLGQVLSTLVGLGFDVQTTVDTAVAEGNIILLADVQTKDFTSTAAAGVQVFLGTNPVPAACNTDETYDPTSMTGCGHHLDGNGMFSIDQSGPTDAALAGKIVGGTFTGGPGNLTLQIALGGTDAITLDLIGARAKATGISETGVDSMIFAGALTQDDLNTKVIPAIQSELAPIIQRDCCGAPDSPQPTCDPTSTPACGCTDGSTGNTILGLLDKDPMDCTVSVEEIQNNDLIKSFLAPDITIDGKDALSLGIGAKATGATYTVPGEM